MTVSLITSFVIVNSYEGAAGMNTVASTTAIVTVTVDGIGAVPVSMTEYGDGPPFLLLHGGAGPQSVAGFAEMLAATGARVIVPVHPGFGGTQRPEYLRSMRGLALTYTALLDE